MADDPTPIEEQKTVEPAATTATVEPAPAEEPKTADPLEPTDKTKKPDEEPAPTEEEAPQEPDAATYQEYEHPALRNAVNILKESGISVQDANAVFEKAVASGDLSQIDRKTLTEKLGKDKADLVLVLAESYYNTTFQQFKQLEAEAHSIVGGKDVFENMRAWVLNKEQTDAEFAKDVDDLRVMMNSGSKRATIAAVKELFTLYKADPNTTVAAKLEQGTGAARGAAGNGPLSRADYVAAIEKAHKEGTYDTQINQLWARRQAGMQQGL